MVLGKTRRPGFQAMLKVARLKIDEWNAPVAQTISFQIAPRINAASRMAHAMLAHRLLVSEGDEALQLAEEIENLNLARRKQSDETAVRVRALAESRFAGKQFIFAAEPDFPYGIVGLIAGRIANEYGKPAAILTRGEEESRGSFRSVPGFSVIEALEKCQDLLVKYGGHEQAAGMTIRNEHLEAFYERFNALAEAALGRETSEPEILVDTEVAPEHLTGGFLRELKRLAPFGEGNPEPVFLLSHLVVEDVRYVGKGEKHLKFRLREASGTKRFEALAFSAHSSLKEFSEGDEIDLVFRVEENFWNGVGRLQLNILDARPSRFRVAESAKKK
jgi:single-stranded-DNA-specific exonuclease